MDDTAAAAAIKLIRDEHLTIASVLYTQRAAVRRLAKGGTADIALLQAILDYLVQFPERLHHPKEEAFLFAPLGERCPAARALIEDLRAEHVRGDALVHTLGEALSQYAADGGASLPALAQASEDYAAFHWQHMTKEEEALLPLARRHLDAAQWERIGAAFRANVDPLRGLGPKESLARLFRRIAGAAGPSAPASLAPEDAP